MNNETTEYRIEGNTINSGWILFDRTSDEPMARVFLKQWQKARPLMDFRLMKVTTTVTREVMPYV